MKTGWKYETLKSRISILKTVLNLSTCLLGVDRDGLFAMLFIYLPY